VFVCAVLVCCTAFAVTVVETVVVLDSVIMADCVNFGFHFLPVFSCIIQLVDIEMANFL